MVRTHWVHWQSISCSERYSVSPVCVSHLHAAFEVCSDFNGFICSVFFICSLLFVSVGLWRINLVITLTVVHIVRVPVVCVPVWWLSSDVDVPWRINVCIINERRVIVAPEAERCMEAVTLVPRRALVVPASWHRVSVRAELYHDITTTRHHRERCHVSTVQPNHTPRQRSPVQ